ncbi:MAG: hypothetical protein JNK82_36540 [Myxococcaceae bacterium]|nr:hypothetical protein [Myxococcaceae bacterium]
MTNDELARRVGEVARATSRPGARLAALLELLTHRREPDPVLCGQLLVTLETFPSLTSGSVSLAREYLGGLPPNLSAYLPRLRDACEGRVRMTGGVHDGSEGWALHGRFGRELLVLQEAALEVPDDAMRWVVLADALLAAGHPLGEWMMRHRDAAPDEGSLAEHLGSLGRRVHAQWAVGLMHTVVIDEGPDLPEVLERLAPHPLARGLQRLDVAVGGDTPGSRRALAALTAQLWPISLQAVRLRLTSPEANDAYVQHWAGLRRAGPGLGAHVELLVDTAVRIARPAPEPARRTLPEPSALDRAAAFFRRLLGG